MSQYYRWHPQLNATITGPSAWGAPLLLRQSDIDAACGIHAALMALMLFGLVQRNHVERVRHSRKLPLSGFWKESVKFYFKGLHPNELQELLRAYGDEVDCEMVFKRVIKPTLKTLRSDGLCIIGIQNRVLDHWVLAVGVGGLEGGLGVKQLLILDPCLPAIPMLPWNATLSTTANDRGYYLYETATGKLNVKIPEALLLLLRMPTPISSEPETCVINATINRDCNDDSFGETTSADSAEG